MTCPSGLEGAGWKRALAIRWRATLRPYATHLLEEGINLRLLHSYLGHTSLSYTACYTHLTRKLETQSLETINQMLERVAW